ncbi:PTS sugar transporter subunit IIA [Leucobacter massiliensis]|uniref:Mannitol-specific phosphotransferase enzyme IIA component n=1 Tax=Leucobacter massiliensis TaxID=1686285 RepID=A0A2S9QQF2_9MICO|nr:PTS sugar transporter subunit IIA [Leucobacter massiliensis]PRI11816.1 PTS mannitol transporter subunit IIA [Leucobacter massiliensis]
MNEILQKRSVLAPGTASDRDAAIREAGGLLREAGAVTAAYVESMLEREASVSTYMGNLLAIPHGTNEAKGDILASALSFVRYDRPIDWGGNEVRFVVGIAGRGDEHLEILSKIAMIFSDGDAVERLLALPDAAALHAELSRAVEP